MRRVPAGIGERSKRQDFEVVKIDDDQGEQEKKLRPLRGVAQKSLDVFDHDRADVVSGNERVTASSNRSNQANLRRP